MVPARVGAGHEPTALVLILDHSLSSGAVSGGVRAFDDLAARAAETLRGGAAVGRAVADRRRRHRAPRDRARSCWPWWSAAKPEPRRLDLSAAVATAARLVRASGYARGEMHVLSDVQRSAFGAADSAAAGLPLLVYHPAAQAPVNRAVVSARATPATWLVGATGAVTVVIGGAPEPPAAKVAGDRRRSGERTGGPHARRAAGRGPAPGRGAGRRVGGGRGAARARRAPGRRPAPLRRARRRARHRVVESGGDRAVPRRGPGRAGAGGPGPRGRPVGAVRLGPAAAGPGAPPWSFPRTIPSGSARRTARSPRRACRGASARGSSARTRSRRRACPRSAARASSGRYRLEATSDVAPRGVLARAGGDPWLVRSGRIVVMASRLVPEETSLPLSSGFVPFVGVLVNRLARGDEGLLEAAPGDPVSLPDDITALASSAGGVRRVEGARTITRAGRARRLLPARGGRHRGRARRRARPARVGPRAGHAVGARRLLPRGAGDASRRVPRPTRPSGSAGPGAAS